MENAFKPPTADAVPPQFGAPPQMNEGQVWRQGPYLIMEKWAKLPPFCIKSNQPTKDSFLKQSFIWHPAWIYITIVAGALVYIILAMVMQKKAVIYVGLTPQRKRRRLIVMTLSTIALLTSIVTFFVGAGMTGNPDDASQTLGVTVMLGSIFVFLASTILLIVFSKVVRPKKITDNLVILRGVNRDYLERFPAWPYSPEI